MIEIWENSRTERPSIQVGGIIIDLGKETPKQKDLFKLVMNNPDTVVRDTVKGPVTLEIADAFMDVLAEEVNRFRKRMGHTVQCLKSTSNS